MRCCETISSVGANCTHDLCHVHRCQKEKMKRLLDDYFVAFRNLQLCRVYALRHVSSDPENDGSRLLWYKRVKGAACSFLLYGAFTRRCSVLDARWGHSASSDRIEPLPLPSSPSSPACDDWTAHMYCRRVFRQLANTSRLVFERGQHYEHDLDVLGQG